MEVALNLSGLKTPTLLQFMPKSNRSSCYQPIHIRRQQYHLVVFQPPMLPGHRSSPRLRCEAGHSSSPRLRCESGKVDVLHRQNFNGTPDEYEYEFDWEIKFDSSFAESADGIRDAAEFICSFEPLIRRLKENRLAIVLPAMGETIEKLLLAVEKAVSCDVTNVSDLEELTFIKDLHLRTADELGIDREILSKQLFELEQLLKVIATIEEMNPSAIDEVVTFGERLSSRIFAAYLNKIEVKAQEFDYFEFGFISIDDLTNAGIFEAIYPAVLKRLRGDWIRDPSIPIVTGFHGKTHVIVATPAGKSDNNLQLAGEKAVSRDINASNVPYLDELILFKDMLLSMEEEHRMDRGIISRHLFELERLVKVIAISEELNPRAKDFAVSFVERMSARIFAAYVNKTGFKAQEVLNVLRQLRTKLNPAKEGDNPVKLKNTYYRMPIKNKYNPKAPGISRASDMSEAMKPAEEGTYPNPPNL